MICPECGKKLPEDAGFCIRCGANQNNPKAEVYKKTRTAEQLEEPTIIGNIIPDEAEKILPEDNNTSDSEPILKTEKDDSEFKAERDNEELPENNDPEDDDEYEDDEDDDNSGKSTRLAVLSVVCVILLVACIVVYFFTKNKTVGNDDTDSSEVTNMTTVVTSVSSEQTTSQQTTVSETVTETLPPETSIVTDADGNSYDIVLNDDIQASVNVDDGTLRLRAYPSTDATVLGIMANGEKVTVKGSCGEWYYIVSDDRTGYAFKEFIKFDEPENTSAPADTTSESVELSETSESVSEISE